DSDPRAGGMIRSQIPKFRLPEEIIDEEVAYITDLGMEMRLGQRVDSLKALLAEDYDAIFVGCGAPRGRDLPIPGRHEAAANIHIGIDLLSLVSFGHINKIGKRVIVLGGRRKLVPTGEPDQHFECDDVLVAVGQENAFPWIERDAGIEFDQWDMPVVDEVTMGSSNPKVFFGGDSAFGPKNIIWAVAHGHQAAISIHQLCQG